MREPMESEKRTAAKLNMPVELVVQVMDVFEESACEVILEKISKPHLPHLHLTGPTLRG